MSDTTDNTTPDTDVKLTLVPEVKTSKATVKKGAMYALYAAGLYFLVDDAVKAHRTRKARKETEDPSED